MITRKALPRRSFLRGMGVAIGLPFLDAMVPAFGATRRSAAAPVRRLGIVYVPMGMNMAKYTPPAEGPLRILITGGSQGARLFGEISPAAVAALPAPLRARLTIDQQVREEQRAAVQAVYQSANVKADCQAFFTDMPERLARAHLVIARAGGSSVTECTVAGRPAILVPLAIGMDDHQTANARFLTDRGAAVLMPEATLTQTRTTSAIAIPSSGRRPSNNRSTPRWTNHSRAFIRRMVSPTTENLKCPGSMRPARCGTGGAPTITHRVAHLKHARRNIIRYPLVVARPDWLRAVSQWRVCRACMAVLYA